MKTAAQRHPLFLLVLLMSAGAIGTEIFYLVRERDQARRATITLEQRVQERDWLAAQSPALSEENAFAIEQDVAAAEKSLAAVRKALEGRNRSREEAPARPTEAYFAIASFVERMRTLAARQQVTLAADERFGFATHANEGPEPELIPRVHLQRLLVEHVVSALLEARPRSLLAVQRERPIPLAQREVRRAADAADEALSPEPRTGGVPADFFSPEPRLRLRSRGLLDSEAVRVEFSGQTQTLRAFLNEIATFTWPLIVRSVEVEPLNSSAPAEATTEPDAAVPLVAQNFSKFAVVLECVEVLPPPEPPTS